MQFEMTSKVDSHHTNPDYKCLVIDLLHEPWCHVDYEIYSETGEKLDKAKYRVKLTKLNIIPTYDWAMQLNEQMTKWKPDYGRMLSAAVHFGDFER